MISLKKIKELLDKSQNPLIFFDDDPDGLCSYLLLMKYLKRGDGVILKNSPTLDESYIVKVRQYCPDLVIVLDKPIISQDFVDKVNCPVIWIDHHPVIEIKGVKYFNPRFKNNEDNRPVTYWCYKLVNGEKWIAMMGIVSDWSLEGFDKLKKDYKTLLGDAKIKSPDDVLYDTEFGKLIKIVSFVLKGVTSETYKFIELMMKVNTPEEILERKTEAGKRIYERFDNVNKVYEELLERAILHKLYSQDRKSTRLNSSH